MRKGLGCGAVGDTRVDLPCGQSEMVHLEPKVHILPQSLTLPIDALKVPVVSPCVLRRSSCRGRGSLLRSNSSLRGSRRRGARIRGCGGSSAISLVGRFG